MQLSYHSQGRADHILSEITMKDMKKITAIIMALFTGAISINMLGQLVQGAAYN